MELRYGVTRVTTAAGHRPVWATSFESAASTQPLVSTSSRHELSGGVVEEGGEVGGWGAEWRKGGSRCPKKFGKQ